MGAQGRRGTPSAGSGRCGFILSFGLGGREVDPMGSSLVSLTLVVAMTSTGGLFSSRVGGRVMPPGPGYGWGFPTGNPEGYGYVDYGPYLPLSADRTPDYSFPRYFALPAVQVMPGTYYNPYVTRGQRYTPYAGCGGWHPASGPPT